MPAALWASLSLSWIRSFIDGSFCCIRVRMVSEVMGSGGTDGRCREEDEEEDVKEEEEEEPPFALEEEEAEADVGSPDIQPLSIISVRDGRSWASFASIHLINAFAPSDKMTEEGK